MVSFDGQAELLKRSTQRLHRKVSLQLRLEFSKRQIRLHLD